jgi:hypothetical protein
VGQLSHRGSLWRSIGLCITSVLVDGLDHGRNQQKTSRQVEGNVIGHGAADEPQRTQAVPRNARHRKLISEGLDPIHATYVFIHYETGVSSSNLPMRTLKTGGHISTGGPDSVRLSLRDALVQSRSESVSDRDLA